MPRAGQTLREYTGVSRRQVPGRGSQQPPGTLLSDPMTHFQEQTLGGDTDVVCVSRGTRPGDSGVQPHVAVPNQLLKTDRMAWKMLLRTCRAHPKWLRPPRQAVPKRGR